MGSFRACPRIERNSLHAIRYPLRKQSLPLKFPNISVYLGDHPMNSSFLWLTIAAAFGAMLALICRPGVIEIVLVVAIANLPYAACRRFTRRNVVTT